ncbi:hypothetical protein IQ266_02680 [filamentous cyanobacterium LEGE 11480]|uniref:DUF4878 domain-containing protein n=1 Tax=Romeriopsis navalis LEGE 11480 TaxID=2777977 RepID=A0A928VHE7_9CYAN|nr:hypothetical protein [Romeriopsis navalis]MBE9028663.1 hypothetical protein [Romeriopsis navalis LEGE 11480]
MFQTHPHHWLVALSLSLTIASCSSSPTASNNPPPATDASPSSKVAVVANSQPKSVVQAIADAATTKEFEALGGLCDPQKQNDGDTQQICDVATDAKNREKFVKFFGNMSLQGEAKISEDGNTAMVEILFGPEGDKAETINLIKRDGKWYLSSF